MFEVTSDQLYAWMNGFIWPFFRILGLFGTAPLFSESAITGRVKVGLAAAIALIMAPTLPAVTVPTASFEALLLALQQVLIGLALGMIMRIVFATVQTAGEFIGLQMGLSFASFFDPATGSNTAVLSRILNLVAMLVFIAVNGHLVMLLMLHRSFELMPIWPGQAMDQNGWGVFLEWSGQLMTSGLLLALPLIVVLLTINLAFGILNRTAQQLTVFAVGFPISLLIGMLLLTAIVPQITPFLEQFFLAGYETMLRFAFRLGGG